MEKREELYGETRKDLLVRQLSNAENYDKAILSLSTACLGFSLAFIKDVVEITKASSLCFLYISWILFGCAIIVTILSYIASQMGISRQLELAKKYYLDEIAEAFNEKNIPAIVTDWCNKLSGIIFILGIIATVLFVSLNIKGD